MDAGFELGHQEGQMRLDPTCCHVASPWMPIEEPYLYSGAAPNG